MGLIDQFGFEAPVANVNVQRAMWKVSSSRPGAWLFAKVLHHVDNLLLRATRGRTSVPRLLAGLPVITLVTTGARTGRRREVPLVGVPCGENLAVIGTRFGQPDTPSCYFNLRARPEAEASYRGKPVPVTAREAEGEEREAAWAQARQIYAGYEAYARRIRDRPVHVMILEPRD